jgi:hypothetical protein
MKKPEITIDTALTVRFQLPGVRFDGSSSSTQERQLENSMRLEEQWTLKVNRANVTSTIDCLQAVINALREFEGSERA